MSIHQEIDFNSTPHEVFDTLSNARKFAELTGAAAEIDPQCGGTFSCFNGMITGMTIEIVPDIRLIQAWRVANWEPGVYSIVKFELKKAGVKETRMIFDHSGFPEEHRAHLEEGWHINYWLPIKHYLKV